MRCSRPLLLLFLGALVVVGLPLLGRWLRQDPSSRCALDGLPIEPLYQVRILDPDGKPRAFCCVSCAQRWLSREEDPPRAVFVTDESSGNTIEAASAHFVRSTVATSPITGNRVHVFADRVAAEAHVRAFGGWALIGSERPFLSRDTTVVSVPARIAK